jgi:multidrug efflux pump subunit AcrB
MKGLISASLDNLHAIIVMALAILVLGIMTLGRGIPKKLEGVVPVIPVDILPVFKSPAVQVLTFYGGMPAEGMEKDITNRMERWTGQVNGMKSQESRSILGASIVRNFFVDDADPNGALTQVNSLALATLPNLPPGTLPPVVLPYDPTSTTPVAIVALDSKDPKPKEEILYDVGRYEARNYIMQVKGASAPVVIGGKLRAVLLELNQTKMQARGYSAADIMDAVEKFNLFFPSGDVKIGNKDYALSSNSMYTKVKDMRKIPLKTKEGNAEYLGDLATPEDTAFIQTNIVRVDGKRQVYIPVYRQVGSSTLDVVEQLRESLPTMQSRLSHSDIDLHLVMDQSVYVEESIAALVQEASLGAVLCALVILLFLGEWRMTLIAIITLPLSVLVAIICLRFTGNTINVMTLAGLTLAIGPMIDSAIICLENTHRHLGMGANSRDAALNGASEVAMPELVSTICTFLVLAPLALIPGMGKFLFLPMMLAVMFAMTTAYLLSRTLVPCFSFALLRAHVHEGAKGVVGRLFAVWERWIDAGIRLYVRSLGVVLKHRVAVITGSFALLGIVLTVFIPIMRRDFFPEVDSGAFEIAVRAAPGLRIEETEKLIAKVEDFIKEHIPKEDLELVISEIGLTADWSSAYTPNSGPQDALVKVQLKKERSRTAQHYVRTLRNGFAADRQFATLEFAFDSGGLVRGALNEGKSTPINIQVKGNKNQEELYALTEKIRAEVKRIDGIVDTRIIQKLDAPELKVIVNQTKAAQLGLTQEAIMKNLIAATNSSITFNKKNFWIDPVTHNQYYVGVQYPEKNPSGKQIINSTDDLLNIPIVTPTQKTPIPLKEVATIETGKVPTEVHHVDLLPAFDLTMGVEGRDLGHVCDDVTRVLEKYGQAIGDAKWQPYDPRDQGHKLLPGAEIVLSGEYNRMQTTFSNLGVGLLLASLLIYFLMVGLDRSFIVPLTVMLVVPLCLVGVLPFLYITGSAINVQSLLGIIFIVGIKVANTVLMTDYAQELRRHEGLSPTEAIRKAAGLRVRPVTMTALAALFAMIPTALALEKGSEANAPLARAILGGLAAGEPATLFVLPALYSLLVRDRRKPGSSLGGATGHDHAGPDAATEHHAVPEIAPVAGEHDAVHPAPAQSPSDHSLDLGKLHELPRLPRLDAPPNPRITGEDPHGHPSGP